MDDDVSNLGRSALLLMLSGFFAQGLQFVGTIFLSRLYGPDAYGSLTLIVNWASVLAVICSMQLHIALHVAQGEDEARELQSAGMITVPMVAIPSALLAWLLGAETMFAAIVLGAMLALTNIGRSALARRSANRSIAYLTVGRAAMVLLAQFGFRAVGPSGLTLGLVVAEATAAITFIGLTLRRGFRPVWVQPLQSIRKKRNFSVFGVVQELAAIAAVLFPFLLCDRLFGTDVVGHFGLAYRLVWAPAVILSFGFGLVFLTELGRSPERFRAILAEVHFGKMLVVVLLLAISSVWWMPPLFTLTLGGEWDLASRMSPAVVLASASFLASAPYRQLYRVRQKQLLQLCIDLSVFALMGLAYFIPADDPVNWVRMICGIVIFQNILMIGFSRRFQ